MSKPILPPLRRTGSTYGPTSAGPTKNQRHLGRSSSSWVLIRVHKEDIISALLDPHNDPIMSLPVRETASRKSDDEDVVSTITDENESRIIRKPSPIYQAYPASQSNSRQRLDSDPTTCYTENRSRSEVDLERNDAGSGSSEKREDVIIEDASTIVTWDGPDDPENPQNWPRSKKWRVTVIMGIMTFMVTFGSSVFSAGTLDVAAEYDVSTTVATLGLSLYVWGFATGPLLWGPGSELFGRKLPMFIGYGTFVIFQIPVAVATNLQTIMICRFFGGMFGAAPLAIVAGALVDYWGPRDLSIATSIFASAVFMGPVAGPIAGEFITKNHDLGWKWTMWITCIVGGALGIVGFLFIPESYHAVLLTRRAKTLRIRTKNWALHSKREEDSTDISTLVHKYLFKPFAILFYEPVLIVITAYLSLVYGILYLFFEAYPFSFRGKRHWIVGVDSLPFLGIGLGIVIGVANIVYYEKVVVEKKMARKGGARLPPEDKLLLMIFGALTLPVGLFWFAWTSNPSIQWVPQVLSGVLLGWGIMLIFMQGIVYIIEVYLQNAASAMAANTFVRSLAGGGFPLFAGAMYRNLGVEWATSTLGFLCIAMIPAPIAFWFWGEKLRRMSRYSPYS